MERFIVKNWINKKAEELTKKGESPDFISKFKSIFKGEEDLAWHKIVIAIFSIIGFFLAINGILTAVLDDEGQTMNVISLFFCLGSYVVYKTVYPNVRILREITSFLFVWGMVFLFWSLMEMLGISVYENELYIWYFVLFSSLYIVYQEKSYAAAYILFFIPLTYYIKAVTSVIGLISAGITPLLGLGRGFGRRTDPDEIQEMVMGYFELPWGEYFFMLISILAVFAMLFYLKPKKYKLAYVFIGWAAAISLSTSIFMLCPRGGYLLMGITPFFLYIVGRYFYPNDEYFGILNKPLQLLSWGFALNGLLVLNITPVFPELDYSNSKFLIGFIVFLGLVGSVLYYINTQKEIRLSELNPLFHVSTVLIILSYLVGTENSMFMVHLLAHFGMIAAGAMLIVKSTNSKLPYWAFLGYPILVTGLIFLVFTTNIIESGTSRSVIGILLFLLGAGTLVLAYHLLQEWKVDKILIQKNGSNIIDEKTGSLYEEDINEMLDEDTPRPTSTQSYKPKSGIIDIDEPDSKPEDDNTSDDSNESPNSDEKDLLD